jgi:hypothetical protein
LFIYLKSKRGELHKILRPRKIFLYHNILDSGFVSFRFAEIFLQTIKILTNATWRFQLYILHFKISHFSSDFKLAQKKLLKMMSKFKMTILRRSFRAPCTFAIFKPTIFQFWTHTEDNIKYY